jgi:uncharacterized membrane protein YbhN (UPF0104 family)
MSALVGSRFSASLATTWLGFGLNGMLPMRLGDLAKVLYARQLFGIPTSCMTAVSVIEKLLDLSAVLLLSFAITQFVPFGAIRSGIEALTVLFAAGLVSLGAVLILRRRNLPLKGRAHDWVRAVMNAVHGQVSGRAILSIVVYTALIWICTVAMTYTMFAPLYTAFGWADACLLTLIVVLAIAIPGAPAGLGIVEAGMVGYLHTVLGIAPAHAVASSLVFHMASALPQILGAAAILAFATLHGKLRRADR